MAMIYCFLLSYYNKTTHIAISITNVNIPNKIRILNETNRWYDNVVITVTDETKQTTTKMSKPEFIKVVTSW